MGTHSCDHHHHQHKRRRHYHRRRQSKSCSVKKASIKNLKAQNAVIENLKAVNAQVSVLTSQTANISALTSQTANISALTSTTGNITTLNSSSVNTEFLNGKNITCSENSTFFNDNSAFQLINDNQKPVYPPRINPKVFDGLWAQTLQQQADLESRIQCGRLQERLIQEKYGCVPCPPTGYENCHPFCDQPSVICACPTESGDCPSVPANIFGIKTISPFRVSELTSSDCPVTVQLSSSIAFGVDVVNLTGNLQVRTVSAFVQVGYLDSNNDFQYELIDFQNRQFGPTYDTLYGEAFSATTLLPSDLVRKIYALMPQINNTAAIQLVLIAEDGVAIDVRSPSSLHNSARFSQDAPVVSTGPVDSQFITDSTVVQPVPPSLTTTVGPNVDVGRSTVTQGEPSVAIDPSNTLRIFLTANIQTTGIFTAYSEDGGVTWTPSVTFNGTGGFPVACCDANAQFDSTGNLFVSYLTTSNSITVVASTDGGKTFSLVGTLPANDQPHLALADVLGSSDKLLYVVYSGTGSMYNVAGVRYAANTLPTSLIAITAACPNSKDGNFGDITITPDGTAVVVFVNSSGAVGPTNIYTNRITGASTPAANLLWDPNTIIIGTTNVGTVWGNPQFPNQPTDPNTAFPPQKQRAPDPSPKLDTGTDGRIYLAYTNASNVNAVPGSSSMDILLRYSDDKGLTWSDPIPVNDTSTNARFFSRPAVDKSTGIVGVSWLDCRNAPKNDMYECFASFSANRGEKGSWIPNVKVSTNGLNNANSEGLNGAGDFSYCSFSQGIFVATWVDNSGPPVLPGNPNAPGTILNSAIAVVTVSQ